MVSHNVTSKWTLPLKLFIPVVWTVFFGGLSISLWFMPISFNTGVTPFMFRLTFSILVAAVALLFYIYTFRLKRVDLSKEFFFVTNYKKSFRYTYDSIKEVSISKFLFLQIVTIIFHDETSMGLKVTFLASYKFDHYLLHHPEVLPYFYTDLNTNK